MNLTRSEEMSIMSAKRRRAYTALPWKKEFKRYWSAYLMMLVPLTVLILFKYIPMYGAQIAFRDYKTNLGFAGSPWVGLKYFKKFLESTYFEQTFRNTLSINGYYVLTFPLSLIFALFLQYCPLRRFSKTVQMVSYAPHFISIVVVTSLCTQFLNARFGLINKIIEVFGVQSKNWMGEPSAYYHIYVWLGVWQDLGFNSIIYIAALSGISEELHEAAVIDGANLFKRIWHVDIPGILPTFCILLILKIGSMLSLGHEKTLLLQNDLNRSVSEIIATYSYRISLAATSRPQYSYASAIGLFTSAINLILLLTMNTVTKKIGGSSLW